MEKHFVAEDPCSSSFLCLNYYFRKMLNNRQFEKKKRKIWILDWCYMCKCNGESVDHLFLHCLVARDLWSIVFGLFGVSWVISQTIVKLLACWLGWFGHHRNVIIWRIIPHCLMWCFWKERNS